MTKLGAKKVSVSTVLSPIVTFSIFNQRLPNFETVPEMYLATFCVYIARNFMFLINS